MKASALSDQTHTLAAWRSEDDKSVGPELALARTWLAVDAKSLFVGLTIVATAYAVDHRLGYSPVSKSKAKDTTTMLQGMRLH